MARGLPVAVIGCGHLGTFHARLYHALAGCELKVVVDIVEEKARALGASLGVPWTTDRAAALEDVRAVSVASPTSTHGEVAGACLRSGRHVLVEKPLAATLEAGRDLVEAAAAGGAVLAVGHIERFNPAFRAARASIGSPRFVESHRLSTFVPRSIDVDVVLDLMIHDIDLTLGLIRAPVEAIDAVGVPVLTAGEDIANARIRFAGGAVANLTASRVSRERVRKIRFFGQHRYVSVDLLEKKVEQVLLERFPEEPAPTGASLSAGAGRAAAAVLAGAGQAVGPIPAGEGQPTAPAPAPPEVALAAYLRERRLRLRHDSVAVPDANALEEELKDFIGAVAGEPLAGASGTEGLRSLTTALEIHRRVQESLSLLGLEDLPPAS